MTTVAAEIELCVDCTAWAANGDEPDDADETYPWPGPDVVSANLGGPVAVVCDGESGHTDFSKSACDGCRRPYSGSRCAAVVFEK